MNGIQIVFVRLFIRRKTIVNGINAGYMVDIQELIDDNRQEPNLDVDGQLGALSEDVSNSIPGESMNLQIL